MVAVVESTNTYLLQIHNKLLELIYTHKQTIGHKPKYAYLGRNEYLELRIQRVDVSTQLVNMYGDIQVLLVDKRSHIAVSD